MPEVTEQLHPRDQGITQQWEVKVVNSMKECRCGYAQHGHKIEDTEAYLVFLRARAGFRGLHEGLLPDMIFGAAISAGVIISSTPIQSKSLAKS